MTELPHSKSCFVCGSRNAAGLKLRFFTDGTSLHARFVPTAEHNGFVNVVHGGILATVLDEVMVWACAVQTKRFCYCAEMNVRYLAPVKPGDEVLAVARMTENRRDRIYISEGELRRADGAVLVRATGKYMPLKQSDLSPFLADFEGTPEQLRDFLPAGSS